MQKYYTVKDVMEILDVSDTTAYRHIATLNEELKAMGYLIPKRGRVPRKYFNERFALENDEIYDTGDKKDPSGTARQNSGKQNKPTIKKEESKKCQHHASAAAAH